MTERYEDILYLPHHVSLTRPQMAMADRAAQFSPFAALTGHDAAIRETARLTDSKIDLTEDELTLLDRKYQMLAEQIKSAVQICITYFVPDIKKSGGAYITEHCIAKKLDTFERLIILENGRVIPMDDVLDIAWEE